jgi:ribosome biogenesis GTPase / thiamine phosphate phosphatase
MTSSPRAALVPLGWDAQREREFVALAVPEARPARVIRVDRGALRLQAADGPARANGRGLAVGDWVALTHDGRVLPLERRGRIARRAAGRAGGEQILAANVDRVLVAHAADRPLHPRRIHRSLVLAWDAGAVPAVILTKADLSADLGGPVAALKEAAPGVDVRAVAAVDGAGIDEIAAWAAPDRTLCLVGESGAGKSTLINALLGRHMLAVGGVRRVDAKGRHTTTARHLLPLPGGGSVIDTPGVRELGLWGSEGGMAGAFADIARVAEGCRFSDCRHRGEPGCAVAAAVADGELDPARVESHDRLLAEEEAQRRRRSVHEERRHARTLGSKVVREALRAKGRARGRPGR